MLHCFWKALQDWFYAEKVNLLWLATGVAWGIVISAIILTFYKNIL